MRKATAFLLMWVAANELGWVLASSPGAFVVLLVAAPPLSFSGLGGATPTRAPAPAYSGPEVAKVAVCALTSGWIVGTILGWPEQAVLRRFLVRVRGWWPLTATGASLGALCPVLVWMVLQARLLCRLLLGLHFSPRKADLAEAAVLVCVTSAILWLAMGAMQWFALRRAVARAGWWILATGGAAALATAVQLFLMLPRADWMNHGGITGLAALLGVMVLGGALFSAITGAALLRLSGQPTAQRSG